MDENPAQAQEGRGFRAVLMPHRSLSPRGFLFLMTFIGGVSFVAGMSFLAMGAWPVMGFFGLDALLVYGAFKINYRAARRIEVVEPPSEARKRRRAPRRAEREEPAPPPGGAPPPPPARRAGATRLYLRSHGRAYAVGSFLTDDERRDLADALGRALADVRGR